MARKDYDDTALPGPDGNHPNAAGHALIARTIDTVLPEGTGMNFAGTARSAARTGAVGLVVLIALTGCGSTTTTQVTGAPSLAAYRTCLQEHGDTSRIAVSATGEPSPSAKPVSASTVRSARKACAALRPPGLALHPGGFRPSSRKRFEDCMAAHGVPLPKPTVSPAPIPSESSPAPIPSESPEPDAPRGGMLSGLDRNDPKTAAALDACRGVLLSPTASAAPSAGP